MRIHEIILIPVAGHAGTGSYSRGNVHKSLVEADLVDQYIKRLVDELDQSSIRHKVVPTRRAPGVPEENRFDLVGSNSLAIVCALGWDRSVHKSSEFNVSSVRFGSDSSSPLAAGLVDTMAHWGALYVHGHKRSTPVCAPDVRGIVIEPFKLNGPDAAQYAARMDQLGRDLGRFLADFCVLKDTGTAVRAPSLLRKVK